MVSTAAYFRQAELSQSLQSSNQKAFEAQRVAEEREMTARRNLYLAHMTEAMQACDRGQTSKAVELLEEHRPANGEPDRRTPAWYEIWTRTHRDLATLYAHAGKIEAIAFSPDGSKFATAGDDGQVRVWNTGTRQPAGLTLSHGEAVTSVSFSPDGQLLATGTTDGVVGLWKATDGRLVSVLKSVGPPICGVTFAEGGKSVACAAGTAVEIWRVTGGGASTVLGRHSTVVSALAISADGRTLASASEDGEIRIWAVGTSERKPGLSVKSIHVPTPVSLAISQNGDLVGIGSTDEHLYVYDVRSGAQRLKLHHPRPVKAVAYFRNRDGQERLLSGSADVIRLWNPSDGSLVATVLGHLEDVVSFGVSPTEDASRAGGLRERSSCGKQTRDPQSACSRATRPARTGSRSRPTARGWHRAERTAAFASGTSRAGSPTRHRSPCSSIAGRRPMDSRTRPTAEFWPPAMTAEF